jgi:hypothetical protein
MEFNKITGHFFQLVFHKSVIMVKYQYVGDSLFENYETL